MTKLLPDEKLLESVWSFQEGRIKDNGIAKRIDCLTKIHLIEVEKYNTGWVRLFVDPADVRYWELDYPQSELHGGGPPRLRTVDPR
jgi:Immunity protein 27